MNASLAKPQPFWQRLRAITLYPVRGAALACLVMLTLASLLGVLPGIGWFLSILVWLTAYKFAFEILRATADGRTEAPEVMLDVGDAVVWKLLLSQILLGVLLVAAGLIGGPVLALAALVIVALMQPGIIISLAIDGSFGNAVNPATTLAMISRIGAPYFAAFGLLFVIQASAATAGGWLATVMPAILGDLLITLFSIWGLFAAFHLMGYLVYQYHEELGYEPAARRDLPRGAEIVQHRDHGLLEQAQGHVRDGQPEAALALLRDEVRSRAVGVQAHELYRRLLLAHGERSAIDDHARLYLHLLMSEDKQRPAMQLLREALQGNPAFVPMQVEHGETLASRAQLSGQAQLALDTWLALLRAHPRNPSSPRWGFDAGTLLAERFGRDAEARVLLTQARDRSEDAALRARIDALLKVLPAAAVT